MILTYPTENTYMLHDDFWKMNPKFKYLEPFKSLYNNDGKNKSVSIPIMWFLVFYAHIDSPFKIRYSQDTTLKEKICSDYFNDEEFYLTYKTTIDNLVKDFYELVHSPVEKLFFTLHKKLAERNVYIGNLSYDSDDPEFIDKMLTSTKSLTAQYLDLKKLLEKETAEKERSDSQSSLSDEGLI